MWSRILWRCSRGRCRVYTIQRPRNFINKASARSQHAATQANRNGSIYPSLHQLDIENGSDLSKSGNTNLSSAAKDTSTWNASLPAVPRSSLDEEQDLPSQLDHADTPPPYDDRGFEIEARRQQPGSIWKVFRFSDRSYNKLGLTYRSHRIAIAGTESWDPTIALRSLDHAIQSSNERGFRCLLSLIESLGSALLPSKPLLAVNHWLRDIGAPMRTLVRIGIEPADTATTVRFRLPYKDVKFRPREKPVMTIPLMIVRVIAQHTPTRTSKSSRSSFGIKDEMSYLYKSAAMVISRITQAVSAASFDDMVGISKLARARWAIPGESSNSDDNLTRKVEVSILDRTTYSDAAEVRPQQKARFTSNLTNEAESYAIIALGSNLGHRVDSIEAACNLISGDPDLRIISTSPLYETRPMYYEDQGTFVNGVCKVVTDLSPAQLLDRLQSFENVLGRVKLVDKGPRNIDLDIITYGQHIMHTERLTIPHKLMLEREFVLRPWCDIARNFKLASTGQSVSQHLQQLVPGEPSMFPITPLSPESELLQSLDPKRKTHVMSILNVTPDSFSDGGANRPTDLDALKHTILSHIAAGATIIDVGGQSSRPNAPDVTAEEEIARILPAIELIKALPEAKHVSISIDTYRASVAEAAIEAGAHIINDISAGSLDPDMLPTIARLGCTYIMMHMRGTPATMQNPENTAYPDGLVFTVATELLVRLDAAQQAGIRRWRIILDPGIGFAKTVEQNAELLGRFSELRNHEELKTYPWLVGTSRKGFIGKITGVEDVRHRVEGTAATVTAAVAAGAEIVRVHDVKEMVRVVKMADAMYRRGRGGVDGRGASSPLPPPPPSPSPPFEDDKQEGQH